jgi:hypothetical protein
VVTIVRLLHLVRFSPLPQTNDAETIRHGAPAQLTEDEQERLVREGYIHLHAVVSDASVRRAVRAINACLGEGLTAADAAAMRVNARSFGDERLLRSAAILDLFHSSGVWELVQDLYGAGCAYLPPYYVQVALRFPQVDDAVTYLPWHVDNVVPDGVRGFGLVVGVFLNDTPEPDSGNFTVFPGGHEVLARHFREAGPQAMFRNSGGRIVCPDVELGAPKQLLCGRGDVVIAHHQLPHRAAPNVSPHIRIAVFFRVYHQFLPYEHPTVCGLRTRAMHYPWSVGWAKLRKGGASSLLGSLAADSDEHASGTEATETAKHPKGR